MKSVFKLFNSFNYFMIPFIGILFISLSPANAQTAGTITPTEVYYLAKSIDESLVSMYELTGVLNKKPISNNLRPRNVYHKALSVVEEFNMLHNSNINFNQANTMNESADTRPSEVYAILNLIREQLVARNEFTETMEVKTPKTPSDVFQILRQISMHHVDIAKKKGIAANWATPAQVYYTVVKNILPVTEDIAKEAGVEHEEFPFPRQPITNVVPRNVYKLLYYVYKNISQYYRNKAEYDPIVMEVVNDCDETSSADVHDLAVIISAELKAKSGGRSLSPQISEKYNRWKEGKEKIVPGDVFRLIQHNFILTRRMIEN